MNRAATLSAQDLWLFNEGRHTSLDRHLGAHLLGPDAEGIGFAVWAPNAVEVSVVGDFNDWRPDADPLLMRESSGIWQAEVPAAEVGDRYKFRITRRIDGSTVDKADPFAFATEEPPLTASVVWDLGYDWGDGAWMDARADARAHREPVSIYELHLGSWAWDPQGRPYGYRDAGPRLADHVADLGFTHVELLPIMEHPFYGSWGYQTTGFFAPSARWGSPQDLMFLVDHLHQRGIGVILDWVPSHFPNDEHGLAYFDGTHLFEHADPRQGIQPDWGSLIFNYDRHEVRSFLLSSAHFWLDRYHVDGLRLDAVASMLYLDYSRAEGEWVPNRHGGNENLGAVHFLRELNESVYADHPGVQTYAEESTAWPGVSRPTDAGGLGFGFKWDMGWMHDTLQYLGRDPVHRAHHHDEITFRAVYAFSENYCLPLSHDEVVHGKGSLLGRMPGDRWQRFANLRLLYGYQYAQPGKKLLFMGAELAQPGEWAHGGTIDWPVLDDEDHRGVLEWLRRLNALYRQEPALHELDGEPEGFRWVIGDDRANSVLAFTRWAEGDAPPVLVVANFVPVVREGYSVGVPRAGSWSVVADSDEQRYGGSGRLEATRFETSDSPRHGETASLSLTLPPLAVLFLVADA
jgi:1,4-alpha-glucan branching enzyme